MIKKKGWFQPFFVLCSSVDFFFKNLKKLKKKSEKLKTNPGKRLHVFEKREGEL